jgi:hypothetical protein
MLIETNRGNGKLIAEFTQANPKYPVANSLVYSIYKMLPNDTDLTVFREDGDIEGLNFAFIDDHYDYHTQRDNFERLDRSTMAHQGSYLMPLLGYFANSDLNNLKSLDEFIYFNVPFFKLVSYPFEWIWPMFAFAVLIFIVLLAVGFKKGVLKLQESLKGFLPLLLALTINGIIGYYSWTVLKWLYPGYKDILHGFTYNGHSYITAFVLFAIAICFWVYSKFKKIETPNLLVAPIFFWLLLCGLVAFYLPGASFFIVPVYGLLVAFMVVINQKEPSAYLLVILALPALWIYAPFIKMFPIGLGLKMMVTATLLTTLTFFLLLPLFGLYKHKKRLAFLGFVLFIGFMVSAHLNSGFTKENAKPTSLLYVLDADTNSAHWATYEHKLADWTAQYIGDDKKRPEKLADKTISSKYASGFTYISEAPLKQLSPPLIEVAMDTLVGDERILEVCITPQRDVNRLEIFTNEITLNKASVNDIVLTDYYLSHRRKGKLITHYISNNGYTEVRLAFPRASKLELTLYEASNDLLHNSKFTVPERPHDNIAMPFVLNDAILVTKSISFE